MTWRLLAVLCAGAIGLAPASASDAQTDEIRRLEALMLEAAGGSEAWRAVSALKLTGVRNRNGYEMGLVTWLARPHRVRVERTLRGMRQVFVFDGTRGWLKNFRDEAFSPAEDRDVAELLDEVEKYLRWPGAGRGRSGARLDGEEEGPDGPAVRLLVGPPDEEPATWLVDRGTGRVLEIVETRVGEEGERFEVHSFFFDERQVEGLRLPFYVEIDHGTSLYSIEVESVEVNPALEDDLFRPAP